jgi:hypothetical protein
LGVIRKIFLESGGGAETSDKAARDVRSPTERGGETRLVFPRIWVMTWYLYPLGDVDQASPFASARHFLERLAMTDIGEDLRRIVKERIKREFKT